MEMTTVVFGWMWNDIFYFFNIHKFFFKILKKPF